MSLLKMFMQKKLIIPSKTWSNLQSTKLIYSYGASIYEEPESYTILKNNINYKITIAGECANKHEESNPLGTIAYASSTATRMAYGGIIVWTTNSLRKRDVIKVKVIRGGLYDAEDYSLNYVGGCGVAIYVNDILKLAVGGGGCCDGARTYSSSGGGGGGYYGGGGGSNGTGIAGSGYSGHSNADGGTMRSCYGGSSYIDSNINSNELSVILGCSGYYVNNYKPFGNSSEPTSGNGGAGYAKIEVI